MVATKNRTAQSRDASRIIQLIDLHLMILDERNPTRAQHNVVFEMRVILIMQMPQNILECGNAKHVHQPVRNDGLDRGTFRSISPTQIDSCFGCQASWRLLLAECTDQEGAQRSCAWQQFRFPVVSSHHARNAPASPPHRPRQKHRDRRTPLSADHNLLDISSAFHLINGSPAVASITTTLLAINEILDAGASIGRLIENVASPKS